ncbi:large conductance mechanosensitive channel protein MscL [Planosporangium mesophilum]|uniref:Large-conductance mechanosensitive channel n=1 Tax=Planosporangium mesophilum TaxID=689768 RepID=A0A8J3WXR1_9ACTN|nr:large conductance mechanosensitive channel protein MscL [Planosporangium mesophilum]NJC81828.1 large conductance mechanosensitive channel protein MscL [Planosporangium mesophilum]GII20510.1 large-conductance mechanosensitive channel [Planosporangium mesophilum]
MLRGFKDFVMRGNVVDLAVGVVIGAAFGGLVTQFTKSFLEPLIRVVTGGSKAMKQGVFTINKVDFDYAAFINTAITFLLTAATVYFLIVLPMNKLAERRAKGHEPRPKAPSEEVLLLREIRDALAGPRVEVAHPDDPR